MIIRNDIFCKKYFPDDTFIKDIKDIIDNKSISRKNRWDEIKNFASMVHCILTIPYPSFFNRTPGTKEIFCKFISKEKPQDFHEIYREELSGKEKKSNCVIS